MSITNQQKKAAKKKRDKEKVRKSKANQNIHNSLQRKNLSTDKSVITVKKDNDTTTVNIDIAKLIPPTEVYDVDSFVIKKRLGYSELYFGNKNPRNPEGDLLHTIIIRISNKLIKNLILKSHKDFYTPLLAKYPITEEYDNQFSIDLDTQFPIAKGSHLFCSSNFLYAANGIDGGELMFYKISPSYLHHISSGKPSIIRPETKGIEGIITIILPTQLLVYVYQQIIETQNGSRD